MNRAERRRHAKEKLKTPFDALTKEQLEGFGQLAYYLYRDHGRGVLEAVPDQSVAGFTVRYASRATIQTAHAEAPTDKTREYLRLTAMYDPEREIVLALEAADKSQFVKIMTAPVPLEAVAALTESPLLAALAYPTSKPAPGESTH